MIFHSKRAEFAFQLPLAIFSVLIIGFVLILVFLGSSTFSKEVEDHSTTIIYEYPKTVVNTFLMQNISKEHSKEFFNNNEIHLIRDLIWVGSESSLDVAAEYANLFIERVNFQSDGTSASLYSTFSQKDVKNKLTIIDLGDEFTNTNKKNLLDSYYNIILTKNGNYVEIVYS